MVHKISMRLKIKGLIREVKSNHNPHRNINFQKVRAETDNVDWILFTPVRVAENWSRFKR